ncbi:MAG: DUF4301 family protein [Proteobacteria bacterium]|nr:MAG: DUF4301 family protein [Pseudomonadota bacterium]
MVHRLDKQEIKTYGLSAHDIAIHQRRIKVSLKSAKTSFIPIIDSFRLDNGGILPKQFYRSDERAQAEGFVAFVPAAGAASRYFQPLQNLRQAITDKNEESLTTELARLKKEGASNWPLPAALSALIHSNDAVPSMNELQTVLDEISWPKALLPCRKNAESFLQKKVLEHKAMKGLVAEVYVAPLGCSESFQKHLGEPEAKIKFLEQGPELSTLRFTREGDPFRDEDDKLSLVPAGHGMLVRLFPEITKMFGTAAHSLFIRNIDNVIKEEAACLADTESFLLQHQEVLKGLKAIRLALAAKNIDQAAKIAEDMLSRFPSGKFEKPQWVKSFTPSEQLLWTLQLKIFHCPQVLAKTLLKSKSSAEALTALYKRPFNSLGQVPNNGKDVGGSPVRARHDGGEVAICLELPHASPDDRKTFLEDPKVATHFNPVFVAAELPEDMAAYDLEQCPFWILAEKNIHGTPVVYHEIVLYEVLGNSYTANVIFPEIPRRLFNPHKSLLDGVK